jgi:hypothetical protein
LPAPQTVTVAGSIPLDFVVDVNQPWIVPSTDVGTTPLDVGVGINVADLTAGTHTGALLFESPNADNGPQLVDVTVVVSTAPVPEPEPTPEPVPEPKPEPTDPVTAIDVQIASGSDDAEQRRSGTVSIKDGDLMLIDDLDNTHTAVRFTGLNIPRGAKIVCASLKFSVNDKSTGPCDLTIRAEASGNPGTFIHGQKNGISSRPLTAASIAWTPPDWTVKGNLESTPCLADLVQENVDSVPVTSIVFVLSGTGKREADSFRDDGRGEPTVLHIEYVVTP